MSISPSLGANAENSFWIEYYATPRLSNMPSLDLPEVGDDRNSYLSMLSSIDTYSSQSRPNKVVVLPE